MMLRLVNFVRLFLYRGGVGTHPCSPVEGKGKGASRWVHDSGFRYVSGAGLYGFRLRSGRGS